MNALILKSTEAPLVQFETTKREAHAYVSIFGNRDAVGDIVHRGAFAKSIGPESRVARGLVPVKHNHETIVGKMLAASEDSTGLLTVQKYATDAESDRIFGMVREGIIPTFSFKARIPEGGARREKASGVVTQHLTELDLLEAGPADPDLAVNDSTFVAAIKGLPDVAAAMGALASLLNAETWSVQTLERLTDEERDALRMFVGSLPLVGRAVGSMMEAMDASDAEAEMDKAMQLDEAIGLWKVQRSIEAIGGLRWPLKH